MLSRIPDEIRFEVYPRKIVVLSSSSSGSSDLHDLYRPINNVYIEPECNHTIWLITSTAFPKLLA